MSKTENMTIYTCDACGKSECVKKGDSPPMQEFRLPMKYYDECGRQHGLSNQRIDLCAECTKALEHDLSQYYDMCCIAYDGVRMKRRKVNEQREADRGNG